jgi:succinoglycan biosynthesis protein ExoA
MENNNPKHPCVSVILATYNEARHIRSTIESLLRQRTSGFDLEVLVVDGKSTDATPQIVAEFAAKDARIRLLLNERRTSPAAFNIGLRAAKGEYVCIFGAHTTYADDYIAVCLKELTSRGVVGCGGRVLTRATNHSLQSRLVAWTLAHPFGSSSKSFRTQNEGYVEIVNYPVMVKQLLIEAGGFDESLLRNEDNDTDQRLRARGHKLYYTWATHCFYHPVPDVPSLLRYGFRNGFWNVVSLRRNSGAMRLHYFVPFAFVLMLLGFALMAVIGLLSPRTNKLLFILPALLLLGVHWGLGLLASLQLAVRERAPSPLWLPLVFFSFHLSYGVGTLFAFLKNVQPAQCTS